MGSMNEVIDMERPTTGGEVAAPAPQHLAAAPRQVATTAFELVAHAAARGASMDELRAFIELQERLEANDARKAYVANMAEFKRNPPKIVKDKLVGYENRDGSFTGYKHATLGSVCAAVAEGLGAHGFSHRWDTEQPQSGLIAVTCVITHSMGHSEVTRMEAPPDNSGKKNAIQQVASTITYLQRYTLLAACGLASHEQVDDDGQGGQHGGESAQRTTTTQAGGGAGTQASGLAAYTEERFKEKAPEWKKLIEDGKKTPAAMIRFLSTKATLTEAQQKTINSWAAPAN